MNKVELFNDHFQNFKVYGIPKAQLIIADPPYNLGVNAYASNPSWYVDGDNTKGESAKAGKKFFDTDKDFRPAEFMHFCSQMLIKEPKEAGKAPCMIVFCEFEQQFKYIGLQEIRFQPLHQPCVPQELFRTSAESQHESCWKLRIRCFVVPRQVAKIQ